MLSWLRLVCSRCVLSLCLCLPLAVASAVVCRALWCLSSVACIVCPVARPYARRGRGSILWPVVPLLCSRLWAALLPEDRARASQRQGNGERRQEGAHEHMGQHPLTLIDRTLGHRGETRRAGCGFLCKALSVRVHTERLQP